MRSFLPAFLAAKLGRSPPEPPHSYTFPPPKLTGLDVDEAVKLAGEIETRIETCAQLHAKFAREFGAVTLPDVKLHDCAFSMRVARSDPVLLATVLGGKFGARATFKPDVEVQMLDYDDPYSGDERCFESFHMINCEVRSDSRNK